MPPRYFTPEEANAALEEVRPAAERMVERTRALEAARARQADLAAHISGNGGAIAPADIAEAQAAVEREAHGVAECIERLQELGCQVKDLETGLLDFPALHEGRQVLLCWRVDEEAVEHWHGPEDGFSGRRPLPFDE